MDIKPTSDKDLLNSLSNDEMDDFKIFPFVKSILSGNSIPSNIDGQKVREKYIDFLDEKYQ